MRPWPISTWTMQQCYITITAQRSLHPLPLLEFLRAIMGSHWTRRCSSTRLYREFSNTSLSGTQSRSLSGSDRTDDHGSGSNWVFDVLAKDDGETERPAAGHLRSEPRSSSRPSEVAENAPPCYDRGHRRLDVWQRIWQPTAAGRPEIRGPPDRWATRGSEYEVTTFMNLRLLAQGIGGLSNR